ncbi:MAG: hypothetical protein FWG65_11545, partial [Turicibacter sp.]|nr:hypothetical protein [Turicibacter sp.]
EAKAKQDEKARKAEFEARRVQEAEARRQAELRATQEAEARRQTELRAVQEAEARKQAELKAAEEERKRILLQAKLKEAEAKAKQEEKARKAEFETKRVQETEARRQAELIAIQEAELEARRIQEAEAKRQAELEIRRVQESNAIRQSELIAAQKAVAKRQAALEARRAQAEREKKSFLMEELMLENNIREDDERWKTIRQFLKVAKNIHEIAQEFVGKPVKVKKRFINNNKVIKDSLEFAELQRIDKRIIQIRNLIPQGEAINNEYAKKFVDAFEELLETITSNLKDRLGVERIPWPSTGKCSQDLLNEGYEKYNTESRFAKSTNDYDKIYEELRVGIRIDDEIVQAPFFNVYE